jgi:LIVCS family branched-chain amino acid:cation transporter
MPWAMLGMLITAVIMPILAVFAVSRHGSLTNLASRIHPLFALVFTILVYLLIGPCVAIPRTASTSYEMLVSPLVSEFGWNGSVLQIVYAAVFFTLASIAALRPNKLHHILGRIMTPVLLIMITVIFIGTALNINTAAAAPAAEYASHPFIEGFVCGYQTLDIFAALNFGIVLTLNIQDMGITDPRQIDHETKKAGVTAGILLGVVYLAMAYIGMVMSSRLPDAANGAEILNAAVYAVFGSWGQKLVGVVFLVACFDVCTGLLSCTSRYFYQLQPKLSYRKWLVLFTLSAFIISSMGLNFILNMALPVLEVLAPIAIILVIIGLILKPKKLSAETGK